MNKSGVIWFVQVAQGVFEPRWLGDFLCDIPALNFVDLDGSGERGIVVGYFPAIFPDLTTKAFDGSVFSASILSIRRILVHAQQRHL